MDSKLSQWCNGLIEAGWLAAVIATPLFFNIHSDRVFEPDKLTLLRSIALLMVAAWLVKFIDQQGWREFHVLDWRHEASIWRRPFILPVFLLVAVYLISTAISVTPRVSWAGSYQRLQGTYTTLSYIVVFALTVATMRTRAQVSRVVTAVIITSIPISFYGLLQHFELDPLPWGGATSKRVAGHMGNAIFIAAYLIMAVPPTVARIIDAFTSILGDEELAYADVVRSSIYIFTLAIQLIAIYWSGSRGPWIGLGAALFAFILIVLVTLRDAATDEQRFSAMDGVKAFALIVGGMAGIYLVISRLIGALTNGGRLGSLAGPMGSFASFAAAAALVVIVVFVMIAAQRGWRWLWLSWMFLTLILVVWLAAFNFADTLEERFTETSLLGEVTNTLVSWQDLPAIGRLSRLLESDGGTGKVRVLIWEGALDLLNIHEPLRFPNGEKDSYNILRPLFGYGPESMYVAYNRFYPPELATIEARNASPDRSHNETFDALVITGGVGFLVWQALYLSVFYYGFRWLGVVRSGRDRNLLVGLWIGGAVVATVVVTQAMGLAFLGVAIPLGSIIGLVAYLIYYALFAHSSSGDETESDPFQVDRLLMIGLVTAVLAHYVEIHFGIAIAATRIHFFVYLGLMYMVGYGLPRMTEIVESEPQRKRSKRRVARKRRLKVGDSKWGPVVVSALVLALVIGILGYEFTTYSLPPEKVIQSPEDLTAGEIFHQSFLVNASEGFTDSPFVFMMIILTWVLGVLVSISEMVKSGELKFLALSGKIPPGRQRIAAYTLAGLALVSASLRFFLPPPEIPSTTILLGRTLLLIWATLCLWAAIRLFMDQPASRLLAGAVAMTGVLFTLPVLIAGGGLVALLIAVASAAILYLLWDNTWNRALVPAGVMAFLALGIGLLYAFMQASVLRGSLFFNAATEVTTTEQLRVLEAEQSSAFLTLFYVFVFILIFVGAFATSWGAMSQVRESGSMFAYAGLIGVFIAAFVLINSTNVRIIQADVIYKRAKPFDSNASRSRNPEDWDIAVAIYERAVELVPKEDFYYLFLGRAYLEQSTVTTDPDAQDKLLNDASNRLLEAQEINPLNTDHTANLARLNTRWVQLSSGDSERSQRLETAEAYYKEALTLSPQNSIIRNEYARLAYDLKRDCEQSIELFNESVEVDPYFETTFFGRAEIYMICANDQPEEVRPEYFSKAAESLEQGLAIRDRNVRAWLQLGQAYSELDEYDKSLVAYQEARSRVKNEVPGWNIDYWMAAVNLEKGDTTAAENLARQALANAPAEAAGQIQLLLSQITGDPSVLDVGAQPVPSTGATPIPTVRSLAALNPAERNNFYNGTPPPIAIDTNKVYEASILTAKGEMRFRLFDDEAPITVNNFIFLAGEGFYDGTSFHRVLENFMAQAGDPTGTGTGGPGYLFADETANGLTFDRPGLLAMANAGPNTNGSQFFITFVPTPHLDGAHTIFGELIFGQEVLASLTFRDPTNATAPGDLIERIDIFEIGQ